MSNKPINTPGDLGRMSKAFAILDADLGLMSAQQALDQATGTGMSASEVALRETQRNHADARLAAAKGAK
jgi:hypothetical protein